MTHMVCDRAAFATDRERILLSRWVDVIRRYMKLLLGLLCADVRPAVIVLCFFVLLGDKILKSVFVDLLDALFGLIVEHLLLELEAPEELFALGPMGFAELSILHAPLLFQRLVEVALGTKLGATSDRRRHGLSSQCPRSE